MFAVVHFLVERGRNSLGGNNSLNERCLLNRRVCYPYIENMKYRGRRCRGEEERIECEEQSARTTKTGHESDNARTRAEHRIGVLLAILVPS